MLTKKQIAWLPLVLAGVFLAIYATTAQRGVSWQDSGEFQYRLLAGDYYWNSGIARAHPLYILLGRTFIAIFPHSLKLYGCSLFSGVCMAMALAVLFLIVRQITSSRAAALAAVVTIGSCHMAWWMSTVAEVYTLSLLVFMVELYLLLQYAQSRRNLFLILLFAVNGAHFAVHNVALLNLPLYSVLLVSALSKDFKGQASMAGAAVLLWLAGSSLIWWQAAGMLSDGAGFVNTISSTLFGDGYRSHVTGVSNFKPSLFFANMALAAVSFASPCWLAAPAGMAGCRRFGKALFFRALAILTLIHFLFWVRYFVADQATFILPLLGLLAIWMGVGCATMRASLKFKYAFAGVVLVCLLLNLSAVLLAPSAMKYFPGIAERGRVVPGRDEWCYWLHPWKNREVSAQDFVNSVAATLRPGDVLFADSTTAAPLMAVEELTPGAISCKLLSPWTACDQREIEQAISAGRFYVVSPVAGYTPGWLLTGKYEFHKRGEVSRVSRGRP